MARTCPSVPPAGPPAWWLCAVWVRASGATKGQGGGYVQVISCAMSAEPPALAHHSPCMGRTRSGELREYCARVREPCFVLGGKHWPIPSTGPRASQGCERPVQTTQASGRSGLRRPARVARSPAGPRPRDTTAPPARAWHPLRVRAAGTAVLWDHGAARGPFADSPRRLLAPPSRRPAHTHAGTSALGAPAAAAIVSQRQAFARPETWPFRRWEDMRRGRGCGAQAQDVTLHRKHAPSPVYPSSGRAEVFCA